MFRIVLLPWFPFKQLACLQITHYAEFCPPGQVSQAIHEISHLLQHLAFWCGTVKFTLGKLPLNVPGSHLDRRSLPGDTGQFPGINSLKGRMVQNVPLFLRDHAHVFKQVPALVADGVFVAQEIGDQNFAVFDGTGNALVSLRFTTVGDSKEGGFRGDVFD